MMKSHQGSTLPKWNGAGWYLTPEPVQVFNEFAFRFNLGWAWRLSDSVHRMVSNACLPPDVFGRLTGKTETAEGPILLMYYRTREEAVQDFAAAIASPAEAK